MRSFNLIIVLALTALTSAGPIRQTPVPSLLALSAKTAATSSLESPASPATQAATALPTTPTAAVTIDALPASAAAPRPIEFDFGGSSQYPTQELRRRQRTFLEQASGAFKKSPYGSGAVPVPDNSAEKGFGGHTLF